MTNKDANCNDNTAKCRLLVTHISNEDQEQLLKLPLTSTCREIKQRWSLEYAVPISDLILRSIGLQEIEDDAEIQTLVQPGTSIMAITLVMDETTDIEFHLGDLCKVNKISLGSPVSEIIQGVKQLFNLEADRSIRLTIRGRVLDPDSSLLTQKFSPISDHLEVDLGFRVLLVGKSSPSTPSEVFCFASDPVIPTLSKESEVSLMFRDEEVSLNSTVGDVFRGTLDQTQRLGIRFQDKLFVLEHSGLQEKKVWDRQPLATVTNPNTEAMVKSEVLCQQSLVHDLNLTTGHVITADVMKVNVRLSSHHIQIFRFSTRSRVQDLYSEVAKVEGSREFHLSSCGRLLPDSERQLGKSGIFHDDLVEVNRKTLASVLSVRTRVSGPVIRLDVKGEMRFTELVTFLRKAGCRQIHSNTPFFCEGCRREISREKEANQKIPCDCCDVRSLTLTTVKKDDEDRKKIKKRMKHQYCQWNCPMRDKVVCVGQELPKDTTIWFRICPPIFGKMFGIRISSMEGDDLPDLIKRAAESSEGRITVEDFTYIYQYGLYYTHGGRCKHALMNSSGTYTNLDGESVPFEEVDNSTQIPIFSIDDITLTPGWSPVLSVDLNSRFFECGSDESATDLRNPLPCDYLILKDPRFVAWIEFYRVLSLNDQQVLASFLPLDDMGVLSLNDGRIFDSLQEACRLLDFRDEEVLTEVCYLLLRHNSRLPHWHIPPQSHFFLNIREGAELHLDGRVVKVKNNSGLDRWLFNRKWAFQGESFQEAAYELMRTAA